MQGRGLWEGVWSAVNSRKLLETGEWMTKSRLLGAGHEARCQVDRSLLAHEQLPPGAVPGRPVVICSREAGGERPGAT